MTEKNYSEREIKEALDNLEAPYDPSSWAKLEARLNAPFTEEDPAPVEEVDKIVYPKLVRLEPAFNEAHWQVMASRLRLIAARRRQVVSTKLLETALVLLVIGNLPAWLGFQPTRERVVEFPTNRVIAEGGGFHHNNNGVGSGPHQPLPKPSPEGRGFPETGTRTLISNEATNSPSPRGRGWGGVDVVKVNPPSEKPAPEISLPEEALNVIRDFLFEKKDGEKPVAPPVPIAENGLPAAPGFFENMGDAKKATGQFASFPLVEQRQNFVENEAAQPFLPLAYHFEKKEKRRTQLGLFVAPETNIVRTPSTEYGQPDKVQMTHGYACGLTFGQKKGRLGFETGITYQAKTLERRQIDVYGNLQDGYVKQLLDKQEYEIVGIPVRLTARLGRARHTTISAAAGLSANAIVQKNSVRRQIATPIPAAPDSDGPRALVRANKKEQSGLFEGGTLSENGFVTADAGLRLERPVGGRMSVYFEPLALFSIKNQGIGLRKDRLASFSWQVGVTATL